MAYTINLTNGTILTTIADGTVNSTSTSLTLIGKNFSNYGTYLNDNFVHLLENSSSSTAPLTPLTGQVWWDTAGNLKVYTGSNWRTIGSITANTSQPTNPVIGNGWWDSSNQQFSIWNGSAWTLVGPAFSSNTGTSGAIVETITSSGNVGHTAVKIYVGNNVVGVFSKDDQYSPSPALDGFPTISPGLNLSNTIANTKVWGSSYNSDNLGSVAAANYARTDIATTFNSTVSVGTGLGLTVGSSNNFTVGVSGNVVQLTNNISGANVALRSNISGSLTNTIFVNGANGAVTMTGLASAANFVTTGAVTATGNLNAGAIYTTGAATTGTMTASGNITTTSGNLTVSSGNAVISGNVTAQFFNGTSIQAQYADLAERFHADAVYAPGTVLSMGGVAEVTLADEELSESVFGVVSTKAAYLMNSGAGTDATHPPVAVSGRVPVRVIGKVKKGDRLVSAGNGLARVGAKTEITPFNVIGRALADKLDDNEGTVYAIVKLNS
jgi:hypothetical protein